MSVYWSFYLLGWILCVAYFACEIRAQRLSFAIVWDAAVLSLILAIVGAHIASGIAAGADWAAFMFSTKGWQNGYTSFGAVVGVLVALSLISRLHRLPALLVLDTGAPAVFIASVFGRLGCFFAGCCYGTLTDLPWAVQISTVHGGGGLPGLRHPVQLYEVCASLVLGVCVVIWKRRRAVRLGSGVVLWISLGLYLLIRFSTDVFRIGATSEMSSLGLSYNQCVAATGMIVCVVALCLPRPGSVRRVATESLR